MEDKYVLSIGEDTYSLQTVFKDEAGRESIELTISIKMTDHLSHQTIYYKEKTCDIDLVIYEAPYFGIDLGTTYSCIAYQKPFINPITNKRDTDIVIMDQNKMEYCIPSSVYFDINDETWEINKVYIGNKAKLMAARNNDYNNYIYDIKRIIGRPSDDPALIRFNDTHSFDLDIFSDKYPKIVIGNNQSITPEQVEAIILRELVRVASVEFGVPFIKDVVVSIPAIFHDAQRKAVHTACKIAGLFCL